MALAPQPEPVRVHLLQTERPDAAVIDLGPTGPAVSDPSKTAGKPDMAHASLEKSWGPTCLVHRACPTPTKALPQCAPIVSAIPWDAVRAQGDLLLGKTVAVRGLLYVSRLWSTTLVGCRGDSCCNESSSHFVLRSPNPASDSLRLSIPGEGGYCTGDDSRLCCPHPATGQDVVATGILEIDPASRWGPHRYVLANPRLCQDVP